jgi:hypothetical protein
MPTENAIAPAKLDDRASDVASNPTSDGQVDDVLKQWLNLAETTERTASATVRKFVDTVDKLTPFDRVGLAKRREVIVAALEMTQRLAHSPYDVGRGLVQSAVLVNVDVDVDVASRTTTT